MLFRSSIPTIPSCAFAGAETLLATAHADGIYSEPVYISDHPTCSVSIPAIPRRAFAGAAKSLAAAHADGIVSAINLTRTTVTAAAPSPVAVPTTVDRKSAPASPPPVVIAHLVLASAPATDPLLTPNPFLHQYPLHFPSPPSFPLPNPLSLSIFP